MTTEPFTGGALVSRAAAPTRITPTKKAKKTTTAIIRLRRLICFGSKQLLDPFLQCSGGSPDWSGQPPHLKLSLNRLKGSSATFLLCIEHTQDSGPPPTVPRNRFASPR